MNVRSTMDRLFEVPSDIAPEYRRLFAAYRIAGVCAFAFHFGLLGVLLLFGLYELAAVNVLSCILWVLAVVLLNRGRVINGLITGLLELFIHAIAATLMLGPEFGFQWYLLFVPISVYFLPRGRATFKAAFAAAFVVTIAGLHIAESIIPVLYDIGSAPAFTVFTINWIVLTGVISVTIGYYREHGDRLEEEIRRQSERAHALLLNILPKSVADQLETDPDTRVVNHYGETTILFLDIVNFTELTGKLTPDTLIELLGHLFEGMDEICDDEGIEKIKTIGDAYMIAAGCPIVYDDHAQRAARCAIRIRDLVRNDAFARAHHLDVRIGMHTGPVVAGVIGKRKFAFDLWGQTVNIASRMESHAQSGKIQMSESTACHLRDTWDVRERGDIRVKGIGVMRTWLLEPNGLVVPHSEGTN